MKDSRKTKSLFQAGLVLLFCVFMAAACKDNSSQTATTDTTATTTTMKTDTTMQTMQKDTMPPLDTSGANRTRPETIKNGGTPPPPPPNP